MKYYQNYGNAIWTNHAIERLIQRGLPQDWAWQAFQYPEISKYGKQPGTMEYERRFDKYLVTIIAKQNERGEWIILSCWVEPPFEKKYQKVSLWGKIWLEIKRSVFGY